MSNVFTGAKVLKQNGVMKLQGTSGLYNYTVIADDGTNVMGVAVECEEFELPANEQFEATYALAFCLRVRKSSRNPKVTGYDLAKKSDNFPYDKVVTSHCSFSVPIIVPLEAYENFVTQGVTESFLDALMKGFEDWEWMDKQQTIFAIESEMLKYINSYDVANKYEKKFANKVAEAEVGTPPDFEVKDGVMYVDFKNAKKH